MGRRYVSTHKFSTDRTSRQPLFYRAYFTDISNTQLQTVHHLRQLKLVRTEPDNTLYEILNFTINFITHLRNS